MSTPDHKTNHRELKAVVRRIEVRTDASPDLVVWVEWPSDPGCPEPLIATPGCFWADLDDSDYRCPDLELTQPPREEAAPVVSERSTA